MPLEWRISSFCISSNCVQVAKLTDGRVAIRDSKEPHSPTLVYTKDEFVAFLDGAKAGVFDFALHDHRL